MKKKSHEKIDEKALRKSVEYAKKQPRLAFYSPLAAAVLNYKKNTVPRYSMSDELSKIVEASLKQTYPSLTSRAKRLLKSGTKAAGTRRPEPQPHEKAET
ncbi:MAG: hypothetical protein NZ941_06515 [Candidatus Caldarchaeum sp.]|nr:hypothetical protein [Candidatus Caldarchaeum sp.]